MDPLLSTRVTIGYPGKPPVLRELRLELGHGEVLGLVGHSGCGKSSLALAILGLLGMKGGTASGSILWNGGELLGLKEKEWRKLRGCEIAYVPQSPMSSLNPALRIGRQLREAWKVHQSGTRQECLHAVMRALEEVSLPSAEDFLRRYPGEMSVGQAQRVLVAMAILHRPSLLIADESTSALDAVTQSEILRLFRDLNRKLGMSILYISHDLPSVFHLCHRVAILSHGAVVECGPPEDIFARPEHPFTQSLIAALPVIPSLAATLGRQLERNADQLMT